MTNTNNLTFNTNKQDQIYDRDEGAYEVANNVNQDSITTLNAQNTKVQEIQAHPQNHSNLQQEVFDQSSAYFWAQYNKYYTDLYFYYLKEDWKSLEDFYKTIGRFNEDESKSLVFAHNTYNGYCSSNLELDNGSFKPILKSIFQSYPNPIQYFHELMQFKINTQLPDGSLEWIKKDLRNALHVAYLVQGILFNKSFFGADELTNFILSYLKYEVIDFNNIHLTPTNYASYVPYSNTNPLTWRLEQVKADYFKNRTNREMRWLKSDDTTQIEWAYNYLYSEKRDYLILQNIFIPITSKDKYDLILASLDVLPNADYTYEFFTNNIDLSNASTDFESIPKISYRAKVTENMKDAWNKFSSANKNDELKQVKIYKKNHDHLHSILKVKGGNADKVISQLVEDEYNKLFKSK